MQARFRANPEEIGRGAVGAWLRFASQWALMMTSRSTCCEILIMVGSLLLSLTATTFGAQQAGSPALQADSAELSRASALLDQTREALAEAQQAVEQLVYDLEDDYATLTSASGAAGARRALVLAMADAMETAQARIAAGGVESRPMMRPSRVKALTKAFQAPVRNSSNVHSRLADWVSGQVAKGLGGQTQLGDVDAEQIQQLVDALFVTDEAWPEFWNRTFHVNLPEAKSYESAQHNYEDAGLQMDRLKHPERYGPRGERAPPGMLVIPGGEYTLGPNSGWPRPRRIKALQPFALDRHEVTNREYATFLDTQPAPAQPALLPRGWQLTETGRAMYDTTRRQHPVIHVNWAQAAAYAEWAGKRLPTEDEWEAAAGGLDGRAYPWGNQFQEGFANGAGVSNDTMPVESFPGARSPSGCFDLAGNAWEWTSTLENGTDIVNLPDGLVNVAIRGGSYRSQRHELATRARWTAPGMDAFSSPTYDRPIGFRCAMDLP